MRSRQRTADQRSSPTTSTGVRARLRSPRPETSVTVSRRSTVCASRPPRTTGSLETTPVACTTACPRASAVTGPASRTRVWQAEPTSTTEAEAADRASHRASGCARRGILPGPVPRRADLRMTTRQDTASPSRAADRPSRQVGGVARVAAVVAQAARAGSSRRRSGTDRSATRRGRAGRRLTR